jgi:hypothetical protein
MFKKRPTPAPTSTVALTSAARTPAQSPVSTRMDAKAEKASAIVAVLESRLQSPFG